jgi:hypothetical protein
MRENAWDMILKVALILILLTIVMRMEGKYPTLRNISKGGRRKRRRMRGRSKRIRRRRVKKGRRMRGRSKRIRRRRVKKGRRMRGRGERERKLKWEDSGKEGEELGRRRRCGSRKRRRKRSS